MQKRSQAAVYPYDSHLNGCVELLSQYEPAAGVMCDALYRGGAAGQDVTLACADYARIQPTMLDDAATMRRDVTADYRCYYDNGAAAAAAARPWYSWPLPPEGHCDNVL